MLEQYGLVMALACALIAIVYGLWAAGWRVGTYDPAFRPAAFLFCRIPR